MNYEHSYESLGFSHARYIENDPVKYEILASKLTITSSQTRHYHDDIELIYVLEGDADLTVNSEMNHISPGNLILLLPSHVHSITLKSEFIKIYQCHISLGFLLFSSISRVVEKHISYSLAYGNVVAAIPVEEQSDMRKDFEDLIQELNGKNLLNTMVGVCLVSKIILLFTRNMITAIQKNEISDHTMMWDLLQYLSVYYSQDITAKTLAAEFSLKPLQVNHYFYLLTGENFQTNLHQTRIRYACSMLQFDQLPGSFIGKYVGYKNTATFYRKFKELKKMTPEEYRINHLPSDTIYKSLNLSWKILLYLYEHYSEPLDELSVSQALFLSPEAIRTELLSSFGATLPELITRVRLLYACSYLQVLNDPVIKISYLSGFTSVRTFNRCFKDMFKETPQAFRARMTRE